MISSKSRLKVRCDLSDEFDIKDLPETSNQRRERIEEKVPGEKMYEPWIKVSKETKYRKTRKKADNGMVGGAVNVLCIQIKSDGDVCTFARKLSPSSPIG